MKINEYGILANLQKANQLTAEAVLEEARAKSSPLHRHFTWDDTEAARAHRLNQARLLIRSFTLVVITKPKENPVFTITREKMNPSQPRAFISSGSERGGVPEKFIAREKMLNSASIRQRHIETVVRAIQGYLNTNSDLKELDPIRAAVDQVTHSLRRKAG